MKKLLLALLLLPIEIYAQGDNPELKEPAIIKFDKVVHDFGSFSESLGKVTCRFVFRNIGKGPLIITKASASCGCTRPKFPELGIAPGDTGSIAVTYNAQGRPGEFAKSVYVYSNTDPEKTTLAIKGNVISEERLPSSSGLTYSMKDLYLKSKTLPFFDIYRNDIKSNIIAIQNGGQNILPLAFAKVPPYLSVKAIPEMLGPGEKGYIHITYNTNKTKEWGMQSSTFYVLFPGEEEASPENKITVTANIIENFSHLTKKELEDAPKIEVSPMNVNLKVSNQDIKNIVVRIANNGKEKLKIHKVSCDGCTEVTTSLSRDNIGGGKDGELMINIDPKKMKSNIINRRILLITNDPARPAVLIPITGVVK